MTVYDEILQERIRQDEKWGEQNHKVEKWLSILGEEFGELCKATNDMLFDGHGYDPIREEAIHVAAVATAIVECLDRYSSQRFDLSIGYLK